MANEIIQTSGDALRWGVGNSVECLLSTRYTAARNTLNNGAWATPLKIMSYPARNTNGTSYTLGWEGNFAERLHFIP